MVNHACYTLPTVSLGMFGDGRAVLQRARHICLLLTDCDGVLTDNSVYYSAEGEAMKRFNMRDGMGVERLRAVAGVDVGIISGENSPSLQQRAAKLNITELHLGVKDKPAVLAQIVAHHSLEPAQVAYIGDDVNDVAVMGLVGLAACPADATPFARAVAHVVCQTAGGQGVLREVAELIIAAQATPPTNGAQAAAGLVVGAASGRSIGAAGQRYGYDERSEW